MKYKLIVREYTENDRYEEEYKEFQIDSERRYFNNGDIRKAEPEKFVYSKALETSLTEEQFKVIQKAVIETF